MRESRNPGLQAEGKRIVRELIELRHDMDNDRPLRYDAPKNFSLSRSRVAQSPTTSNPTCRHTTTSSADSIGPLGAMSLGCTPSAISTGTPPQHHPANLRLLKSTFASTIHWTKHDPFSRQKNEAFRSSKQGVLELADHFRSYATHPRHDDEAQRKLVFVIPPLSHDLSRPVG
jgi:Damage-control phosphatase ARMT1-like domain